MWMIIITFNKDIEPNNLAPKDFIATINILWAAQRMPKERRRPGNSKTPVFMETPAMVTLGTLGYRRGYHGHFGLPFVLWVTTGVTLGTLGYRRGYSGFLCYRWGYHLYFGLPQGLLLVL